MICTSKPEILSTYADQNYSLVDQAVTDIWRITVREQHRQMSCTFEGGAVEGAEASAMAEFLKRFPNRITWDDGAEVVHPMTDEERAASAQLATVVF